MNRLKEIVADSEIIEIFGDPEIKINHLVFDSRKVQSGSLFFAVRGTQTDGHNYISLAIESGAVAVVCEVLPVPLQSDITWVLVKDTSKVLGEIASVFFNRPSSNLKLVGVTGTNGKTTTATLLSELVTLLGFKSGLISTIENRIGDQKFGATHTTPDSIQLNELLSQMIVAGVEYCFMEVSSHAIDQHRISGLNFVGGIFSNLTHDHLDYHKTFDEYLKAKKRFFDLLPNNAFALTNVDDKNGLVMLQNCKARTYTYGLRSMADFKAKVLEYHFDGTLIRINNNEIWSRLIGDFNVYNLLAVYGTATILGFDQVEILKLISRLTTVNGRFEYYKSQDEKVAIVDYAHTPDALLNVLKTIQVIRFQGQQIITVVGAGGNRDKTKRPVMAKVAAENSDRVILTSDNPRNEDPEQIIHDMLDGVKHKTNVLSIVNRREAIKAAFMMASKGDIILVAGKGHENYQEINGVKHHFDDREVINEIFQLK